MSDLDPVLLAVLKGRLEQIADEMDATLFRSAFNPIIAEARDTIWLYGMAEYRYAHDPAVPTILAEATGAGCEVKVLLLDPELPEIAQIDQSEGNPAGTLSSRIQAALDRFLDIAEACGPRMRVRTYLPAPTTSIVLTNCRKSRMRTR